MGRHLIAILACLLFLPRHCAALEPSIGDDVRQTVARAVPYLKREGAAWIEERGCVSCHQVPFMLWSLSAARENGFDIDAKQLRQWQDWSVQTKSFVKPEQKADLDQSKTLASNIDTMNALLLAIPVDDAGDEGSWRNIFTTALVNNQKPDGSWRACGQLPMQKRPKHESTQVTVLWTLLALARQQVDSHDQRTALKVADNPNPASTEWWVARLLLADQTGDDQAETIRRELLALQREDGGWGWLTGEPSDALATGMALYALRRTASSSDADHAARTAATRFLTSTQKDDGSWTVHGTKKSTRNEPTPTSSYWGTAWAVIGLLQ